MNARAQCTLQWALLLGVVMSFDLQSAAQATAKVTATAAAKIAPKTVTSAPVAKQTMGSAVPATPKAGVAKLTTVVAATSAKNVPTVTASAAAKTAKSAVSAPSSKAQAAANAAALAKKFAALQQSPAYKAAMATSQNKQMQNVYNNSVNAVNTFFEQYALQITADATHANPPSTANINRALTTIVGSTQTFTLKNQQAALDAVFTGVSVPKPPAPTPASVPAKS